MTEKEIIETLEIEKSYMDSHAGRSQSEALAYAIEAVKEIQQYRAIGTVEEIKMLKDFKELYDAYKLIGTIEEFRNLKYKKNVLPIATIEFSKEDMQKIVDEKVAQIELDVQGIRAEAIDELKNKVCIHFADWKYSEDDKCVKDIIEWASESVEEIAEQMRKEV